METPMGIERMSENRFNLDVMQTIRLKFGANFLLLLIIFLTIGKLYGYNQIFILIGYLDFSSINSRNNF